MMLQNTRFTLRWRSGTYATYETYSSGGGGIVYGGGTGAIQILGCSILDQTGQTYYLIQDILNATTSQCINITANNVTLDCQGHTIDGNDSATYGVYVYRTTPTTSNATIKNCTVSDWNTANIYFRYANGNTLENITSLSSPSWGIWLNSSNSNNFTTVTANSNGSDGIFIQGSNNNLTSVIANSNTFDGIEVRGNSNTLTNITANSNSSGNGVLLYIGSASNVLSNINASSNRSGVNFTQSSGNTLQDSTLTNNSRYDIDLYAGVDNECNNTVSNVTGTGNKPILYLNTASTFSGRNNIDSEIILCNADNSNLSNIILDHTGLTQNNALILARTDNATFNNITLKNLQSGLIVTMGSSGNSFTSVTSTVNDDHGIEVSAPSNTFTNVTANNNDFYGVLLWGNSNIFDGLTANSNDEGVVLIGSLNTIKNSHIESNTPYGIRLSDGGSSGSNTIYNNVFRNNTNFYFSETIYANNWNVASTTGPNIIGGSYIGGNYWTNPSGTGYSDTCTDSNSDGFCDNPYVLPTPGGPNQADNLPLKP